MKYPQLLLVIKWIELKDNKMRENVIRECRFSSFKNINTMLLSVKERYNYSTSGKKVYIIY